MPLVKYLVLSIIKEEERHNQMGNRTIIQQKTPIIKVSSSIEMCMAVNTNALYHPAVSHQCA